jgi:hypothetical protein
VALTEDERRKIYEEEKEKLETQQKIKSEIDAKNTKTGCMGCLGFIGIVVGIIIVGTLIWSLFDDSKSSEVHLHATVTFNCSQFKITNKNDFNWDDVEIRINSESSNGGYWFKSQIHFIPDGEYTIDASRFAKRDGTRFNPLTIKPQNITITCVTSKGRGFYFAKYGD